MCANCADRSASYSAHALTQRPHRREICAPPITCREALVACDWGRGSAIPSAYCGRQLWGRNKMEPAIKRIVETYVRLRNRGAIEDLLIHRRRLVVNLRARLGYDVSRPLAQIEEEIGIILAALDQLE